MKKKFQQFISNPKYIFGVYLIAAVAAALSKYLHSTNAINNYLIFKNVFVNTIAESNLYMQYPDRYIDNNHYGVFFSLIMSPFALFPDWAGVILWNVANVSVFLFAIYKLPFSNIKKSLFGIFCLQEYITTAVNQQFNAALAGLLLLSAIYIYEQKEFKSAALIVMGFFIKIYGIVGLSQFFFVKNKFRFVLFIIISAILFFLIPMIYSSPQFVIQSYTDWSQALISKNNQNLELGGMQDISLMGFVRRVLNDASIPNLGFLAFGLPLFALPYIRVSQYKHYAFQLMTLASSLLFLVLFSSGSESPTYIIAVAGVMLWFVMQKEKSTLSLTLFILVIIFTSFSNSDLFPRYIKNEYIIKYSIKAVPCVIVWLRITYELMVKDFKTDYSFN